MFVFDDQIGGAMPTSSIYLHDDKIRREGLTDLLQEEIHHLSGSLWQNQRDYLAKGWSHRGIHIGVLSHNLYTNRWAHPRWHPTALRATDAAKTPLILCHDQNRTRISFFSRCDCRFHLPWKFFLNCSCTWGSAWGCLGRGISLRQP